MVTRLLRRTLALVLLFSAIFAPLAAQAGGDGPGRRNPGAVFFVSDGMRQDLVARYAAQGLLPTMGDLMRHGVSAAGNGLLTQAPPNTGAGWYSLASGAWPAVTGSTNNTFHINGKAFASSTSSFGAGVPQAESLAQAAERAGMKVAEVEFSGAAEMNISGPTVDFRRFFSGRGVATNYVAPSDTAALVASFGLQFDT